MRMSVLGVGVPESAIAVNVVVPNGTQRLSLPGAKTKSALDQRGMRTGNLSFYRHHRGLGGSQFSSTNEVSGRNNTHTNDHMI